MADTVAADTTSKAYIESEDHVPDPTLQFGTLDTSGTAGGNHERLEHISPVFDVASATELAYAARAVDPEDTDVDESSTVVLPAEGFTADQARDKIRAKAEAILANPPVVEDPSVVEADKANARKEEVGPQQTSREVEGQQRAASPAGGTGTEGPGSKATDSAKS